MNGRPDATLNSMPSHAIVHSNAIDQKFRSILTNVIHSSFAARRDGTGSTTTGRRVNGTEVVAVRSLAMEEAEIVSPDELLLTPHASEIRCCFGQQL